MKKSSNWLGVAGIVFILIAIIGLTYTALEDR